jgi:CelD/BcsL family acetyltransferase involved in cellulose biosynthesis
VIGGAMFDYVVTDVSPTPPFVLEPPPRVRGRLRAHALDSHSIVLELPVDEDGLHRLRSGPFWKGLRRRRRRFEEVHGPWRVRVCTTPAEVATALPAVRALFAERWQGRFTSLPWHTDAGFAPAARALTSLAARDETALVLLECDDRLLAFSCLLLQPPWCYAWQHATTPDAAFRPYSLGTHLDVATFRWLITDRPSITRYDFMLGDDAYKHDWETWRRPVFRLFDEPATPLGALRLASAVVGHRLRRELRDRPRLHATAQRLRFALTAAASSRSRPTDAPVVAGHPT